ncbi:RHS repeat-associated core domain-containing protein [Pseudomonas chlororaphis]|uniref:RHS repeat-associated core domain-containing protein n=1 Tax=Pseudomonas chlororaphis TaxID=587753 RepID=UPI00352A18AD
MSEKTVPHPTKNVKNEGARLSELLAEPQTRIFSQAAGMQSLSYGLNSRTGRLQAAMVLGQISYGIQAPVDFVFSLYLGTPNYYRLSAGDDQSQTSIREEYGLNVPLINPWGSGKMHFSDGTVDKLINFDSDEPTLQYHRLKDIKIERLKPSGFRVTYKSGVVEYYDSNGVILRRCSPSGFVLNFVIEQTPALNRYRLMSVTSEGAEPSSLTVNYGAPNRDTGLSTMEVVQKLDGRTMTTQCILHHTQWSQVDNQFLNVYVEKISLPNDFTNWIQFSYRDTGSESNRGAVLEKIIAPTGEYLRATESGTAKYYEDASATPPVLEAYSVVTKLVEGNQKGLLEADASTVTYEYSPNMNCTGYYPGRSKPVPNEDNCLLISGPVNIDGENVPYEYSSTAHYLDRTVQTTYNRFHLPTLQTTKELNGRADGSYYAIEVGYDYPIVAGDISQQPAQFALWTSMATIYSEHAKDGKLINARKIYEMRSFDEYGNLLKHTQSSGIQQELTYYPSDSKETEGCPPSPLFVQFVKKVVTFPAGSGSQPLPKTNEYTYVQVNGLTYNNPITKESVTPYLVMVNAETINGLTMGQSEYLLNPSHPILTGVTSKTQFTSKVGAGEDVISLINATNFNWTVVTLPTGGMQVNCRKTNTAQKGGGALQSATGGANTFNPSSGRQLEEVSPTGAVTRYEYNDRDWLIKTTTYVGTPYEEILKYDFKYWYRIFADDASTPMDDRSTWANRYAITYPNGRTEYQYLDRDGLLIYEGHADSNQYNEISRVVRYNRNGPAPLVAENIVIDYVGSTDSKIENKTLFAYRLFGQVRADYADGTAAIMENNLAANPPYQQTRQRGQTVDYRSEYNHYGSINMVRVTFVDPGGATRTELVEVNEYDGFGRLVRTIPANANGYAVPISFQYDKFDRVTRQSCGTDVTTYTYSAQIPIMGELTRIQATTSGNSVMDATRTFDDFGRLIDQNAPGEGALVTQTLSYSNPEDLQPELVTCNIGTIAYDYNQLTQMQLKTTYSAGTDQQVGPTERAYTYNPITKQMMGCEATGYDLEEEVRQYTGYYYDYNSYGMQTKFYASYKEWGGGAPTGVSINYTYSKFSSFQTMAAMSRDNAIDDWMTVTDAFDSNVGRLTTRSFVAASAPEGRNFIISVTYVTDQGVPGAGKVKRISLKRNYNKHQWKLLMEVDFVYDQYGSEQSRSYTIYTGPLDGTTSKATFVATNTATYTSQLSSNEVRFTQNTGSTTQITRLEQESYTYADQYQQLLNAVRTGTSGADGEYQRSEFSFKGFYRFNEILFKDSSGKKQRTDFYEYFNNDQISKCTVWDSYGSVDIERSFSPTYDANGNIKNAIGITSVINQCEYSPLNQLTWWANIGGPNKIGYSYLYDGLGQLIHRVPDPANTKVESAVTLVYNQGALIGELGDQKKDATLQTLYLQVNDVSLGRYLLKSDNTEELELFCTDAAGTVRAVYRYTEATGVDWNATYYEYSDYGARYEIGSAQQEAVDLAGEAAGERAATPLDMPIGFNGYLLDQPSGCYVLGNGNRFYNPSLRAFYSPDSLSPFGEGGINRYQYCNLDPVNLSDPSGNAPERGQPWEWYDYLLTVLMYMTPAGAIAESFRIASWATYDENSPKTSKILGHFAEGVDLATFFVGNMVSAAMGPMMSASKAGVGTTGAKGGSRGILNWKTATSRAKKPGGFKTYTNSKGGKVYLSKTTTNANKVYSAIIDAYGRNPNARINVISGTHGNQKGLVQGAWKQFSFAVEDMDTVAYIQSRVGGKAKIRVYNIQKQPAFLNVSYQNELVQAAQSANVTIFAYCHSGLNSGVRSALGLKPVRAPWRWWG